MIYFIQAGAGGLIRIGCSIEPWNRIKQLQLGCPDKLVLLKAIPGDKERIKDIYKFLSPYKKQGKLFYPTNEVINFIQSIKEAEYEVIGTQPYAVLRRDTETSETDHCPFCDKRHHHGAGEGHRVAHCSSSEFREEVKAGNIILRKIDGYILKTRWMHK
jgi:hypothetical protein